MATTTSKSAKGGPKSSKPATRSARGAAGASSPTKSGTSATKTAAGRSTKVPSTKSATAAPPDGGKSPENPESGEVAQAAKRDLATLPDKLAGSGLARTYLALARELDSSANRATAKSMAARAMLETWNRLLELKPPDEEPDDLDDLAARRAARRDRISAAADLQHPAPG